MVNIPGISSLDAEYKFYVSVYDLITGGKSIISADFLTDLDSLYYVEEGKVNFAQELLSKFISEGYYSFTNEEFPVKLIELYKYLTSGEFKDIKSYIEAANTLLYFIEFTDLKKEDIYVAISKGVEFTLQNVDWSPGAAAQFDMLAHSINDADLMRVYNGIKERIKAIEVSREQESINELNNLIAGDPDKFISTLMPKDLRVRTPDKPVLEYIEIGLLLSVVPTWSPAQIAQLTNLFEIRYLSGGFTERLTGEIATLEKLYSLNEDTLKDHNLTRFTILKLLRPEIEKSIKLLKSKLG